ncbi:MAG: class I SAM-dependent methyltransferase [Cyanobacteria bacterium P01_D01_bin.73]
MTATVTRFSKPSKSSTDFASRTVNLLLGIKPIASFAKNRARSMMIQRAEELGIPWRSQAETLQKRDWSNDMAAVENPDLAYPDYYLDSFHAYEEGNLGWFPATEVEVAAYTVHSKIWGDQNRDGDARMRQSFTRLVKAYFENNPRLETPQAIADLGCSVGMSTFALQDTFPRAQLTGIDLSPHFLAVARYNTDHSAMNRLHTQPHWVHAAAEDTKLPDNSFDLITTSLMFHELPQSAAIAILQEAQRLLKPGGTFALMDMNPQSHTFQTIPPFVFTLLKSTEPYLDQYLQLDLAQSITDAGFNPPTITVNTPRHRTVIATTPR